MGHDKWGIKSKYFTLRSLYGIALSFYIKQFIWHWDFLLSYQMTSDLFTFFVILYRSEYNTQTKDRNNQQGICNGKAKNQ